MLMRGAEEVNANTLHCPFLLLLLDGIDVSLCAIFIGIFAGKTIASIGQ